MTSAGIVLIAIAMHCIAMSVFRGSQLIEGDDKRPGYGFGTGEGEAIS